MKNAIKTIGIIAIIAIMGLGVFTSCEEEQPVIPTDITVTGIPSQYLNKLGSVSAKKGDTIGFGMPIGITQDGANTGKFTCELVDDNGDSISIEGNGCQVVLLIYENLAAVQNKTTLAEKVILSTTIKATGNTFSYSQFADLTP